MKQQWAPQELIDHWTLTAEEMALVRNISQTDYNQCGYALMFKCFQREGKFPQRKQDIPPVVAEQIAQQLHVPETLFEMKTVPLLHFLGLSCTFWMNISTSNLSIHMGGWY